MKTGLSLAQFLRGEGVPIVMITGVVTLDELHAHDLRVLAKPFSVAELEDALREAMEQPARSVESSARAANEGEPRGQSCTPNKA